MTAPGTYQVTIERDADQDVLAAAVGTLIGGRWWWNLKAWREDGSYYRTVNQGYAYTERGAQRRADRVAKRHAVRQAKPSKPRREPWTYTLTIGGPR